MLRHTVFVLLLLASWSTTQSNRSTWADENADLLRPENQVAWCIVPFDAKKRSPADRATMLKELGITRCAYDWRDEHVTTFEQEILEYEKNGIEYFAFWGVHDEAFKLFQKYHLHPQIWQMIGEPNQATQAAKVEQAAQQLLPLARRTQSMKCKLGIYNHGGWGGEPANMVAVCKRLHEIGQDHVGIVYNFHHGHGHIEDWAESLEMMLPYLHCVNLNGMNAREQPKILGIGKGDHELAMIRVLVASGYDGPIGILDHREQLDARQSLIENRDGLKWIQREIAKPGSGGPKPHYSPDVAPHQQDSGSHRNPGRVFPGAEAYRHPPITVEARATIHSRGQYNMLVASDTKQSSDHWELFTMNGSGDLTAYLPGSVPDHVRSTAMICDGKPHSVSMHYEASRVCLYVDGERVADQRVQPNDSENAVPSGLAIGRLVEGVFDCDGEIEWVRISKGIRDLPTEAVAKVTRDQTTVGYWNLTAAGETIQQDSIEENSEKESFYDAARVEQLVSQALKHGDPVRGAAIFADAKVACLSCHKIAELGGTVGPDLSAIAKDRKLGHIVESVLWPKREVKPEFTTWRVLTSDDEFISGYKVEENSNAVTIRDITSGDLIQIASDDIEIMSMGSTVMPDGLAEAMSTSELLDVIRFLSELGRDGQPPTSEMKQAISESQSRSGHSHGPAEFPIIKVPLSASGWSNSNHPVNRDRVFDFYTKQAEHFRAQSSLPSLLSAFPGLDSSALDHSSGLGHWGNQNEETWADRRWSGAQLGSVQLGVFHSNDLTVARGVCVRLGDQGELSTCFNPDTLTYDALWSGGFVTFDSFRHGFMGGLRMDGQLRSMPTIESPNQPFLYHGFYRHGNRIVFAYRIGDVEYLDSPWVVDGHFVREVTTADQHSLRMVLTGGPPQWPQVIETQIFPGTGQPYAVDTIELPRDNPWKIPLFCGDHDFFPDGSALVATMQGDVWRVTGLDSGTHEPGTARWRRFASGLHHPLGLVVAEGRVYVQCRDQLMRLEDKNGDGEADFYECFSNAFVTSAAGHDFICGLQRDEDGNFYTASGNQGLVRISPDGERADVVATGFRNPDGLGILPDGSVTVPVSEGEWTPASAINRVRSAADQTTEVPPHFGYQGPKNHQTPELPLVYLPRGIDNSSGGQVFVDSDSFGPLKGQLLHFSFGAGSWFVILQDEVDGQFQGAVVPMTGNFQSGAHRGRFSPTDGQLYVSGMNGWGSYTPADGCFERVRFTGAPVQVPTGFHVHANGIRVTFSSPIDPAIAEAPSEHFAQCWNYRYSGAYGSPELSSTHPGVVGHDTLAITSAHVMADGHSLFLEIPDLQPVSQLHLRLHVNEDDALTCSPTGSGHDLFATVHKLDRPFVEFTGYVASPKTIAAHPLLVDLAQSNSHSANLWEAKIDDSRDIEIATDKNLTYQTKQFTVKANEPIALTLSNPDVVPHNWVLARPATLKIVGELGNQLIADPQAFVRQYIPETDAVLVHTDVVPPGDKQTIYFRAPSSPGHYPYLCTFPGHWMIMNGTMVVE